MSELKPCQCGGPSQVHTDDGVFFGQFYPGESSNKGYRVECEGDCHAMTCWWHDEEDAIKHWNHRPEEDRLREALIDVWRVMGPDVPSEFGQVSRHEWGEALRIIKAALPGEVLPYEKGGG